MIYDTRANFQSYVGINASFGVVADYLHNYDLFGLEIGRIELEKGVYANVDEYNTRYISERYIECHRKFIDIQIVLKGREKIGVCSICDCNVRQAYDDQKDVEKMNGAIDLLTLKPELFMVLFPQDGHMPGLTFADIPEVVKKVVFKVPVN